MNPSAAVKLDNHSEIQTREVVMKSRLLLAIALLFATTISGLGKALSEEKQRNRLQTLRTTENKNIHPTPLEQAYLDTYRMLGGDNQCGRFFGGIGSSLVLEELIIRLRNQVIPDARIGIRMWGTFTMMVEPKGGIAYRLFERSDLNSFGAFYKARAFPSDPYVPKMGSFLPNTREARALILLHELAHMIMGQNGTWLIPDDGDNPQLSRLNTLAVEEKCGREIRSLSVIPKNRTSLEGNYELIY